MSFGGPTILYKDRVKETTTTTGTGAITLAGAATGFISFNTAFGVDSTTRFYYTISSSGGTEWEVGYGYLSGSTTLVRDAIMASSNSGNTVSLSAGTKDIFCTIPADFIVDRTSRGRALATARGMELP